MPPPIVALWIVHVGVVQLVGILWFDWLCGAYTSERRQRFERQILLPMGGAVLVACLVGWYQGLVDVHWVSGGLWPGLGRATGTLGDANVFGMVAALWAPLFLVGGVAVVPRLGTRTAMWLGGIGLLIASGGVWMSGSRTAFLALAVGVTLSVAPVCRRLASRDTRPLPLVLGAAALLVAAAFAALVFVLSTGPGERIREMLPPLSVEGAQGLARTLWNRGWYGPAAQLMIRDHPFVGVGVGAFHPLVGQYARLAGNDVAFDNAHLAPGRSASAVGRRCGCARARYAAVQSSVAQLTATCAGPALGPDFRFRCGTVTHRISSRALIARVPTQEPRDGG